MDTVDIKRHDDLPLGSEPAESPATAYSRAGSSYLAYADGDPENLFSFEGPHGYSDRCVWSVLEAKLTELRAKGASSVSVLDAGCGPGTWLRRIVARAKALGFTSIVARGFDVAAAQIEAAERLARPIAQAPDVDLSFGVADLTAPLPESTASVDITLCLYSVLSHLPVTSLPMVAEEIARVTRGHFITTARSIGSMPTIFVDSIEKARQFRHDHGRDRCMIELHDGSRFSLDFHLFGPTELRSCFSDWFVVEDLRGLDLFHSRFAPDSRWNPASLSTDNDGRHELARLEEAYSRVPWFMERATHLMLVGHRRRRFKLSLPADRSGD